MPELPDLEVIREYLERALRGQRVQAVEVLRPLVVRSLSPEHSISALEGDTVREVSRRGKFLILELASGLKVIINPMLAGKLQYCPPETRRPARTILILGLSDGNELRYVDPKSMGKVYLSADEDLVPGISALGPEALDPALTPDVFLEIMCSRRGEVKGLLTNQAVIAGIGNAYADEILFAARLYPFRKRPTLSDEEIERLYYSMRTVLSEAMDALRQRTGDDIYVKIRDFLQVHGKGGSPCPRCGSPISEITARGRLTNFCRACQPGKMIAG
jgi:formamidopyrimidine-DNA glycosylase